MLVAEQPAPHDRGRRGARARASATGASQHLGDLAAFTGGQVIAEEAGLTLAHVESPSTSARARRVIVTADSTTFIEGGARARRSRRGWRRSAPSSPRDRRSATSRSLQERLARLSREPRGDPRRRADRRRAATSACAAPRARSRPPRPRSPRASCPAAGRRCCAPSAALDGARARGRLRARRRHRAQRADRAAVLDRHERRLRRPGGRRPGRGDAAEGHGPRRAHRRVRRPVREGRDRPGARHAADASSTPRRSRRCCSPPRRSSPRSCIAQPGAMLAPGFGDLAEGLARPVVADLAAEVSSRGR